jgi:uncharacterized protein involved in cysteine biosynthesis
MPGDHVHHRSWEGKGTQEPVLHGLMIKVIESYSQAHRLLWKHGLWRYLLIPLLIAPVLLVLIGSAMYFGVWTQLFSWIEGHWLRGYDIPAFVEALLFLGVAILLAGPGYVAFRGLLMVCYAPFMDGLVSKTIRIESGGAREGEMGLVRVMVRALLMVVYTTVASLAVVVVALLLGLFPGLGPALSFAFSFPLQMFLCGVSSVDPCLERYDRSAADTVRLMWRHKVQMVGFGLISTAGMFIPLVGWFVSPTYSLVAGVILGMRLEAEEEAARQG